MEVNIILNGKNVKTDSTKTILQVARENNIDIPTLCYLKEINEPASCRVCVVEVEGAKNLVTSCSTKVKDGMVIKTNTQKVLNARKTALELLLSNHNRDCLNCNKNLKCDLQKLTEKYMCNAKNFEGEKTTYKIDDSNNAIVRDNSKCILCGKCVAVCSRIQEVNAIGKVGRGFTTEIGTSFNKPLQNTSCIGCGQCILVCPTGALSQKNNISDVLKVLDSSDVIKVAQVAPAVRVSLAEEFGEEIGTFAEGRMVSALKECGFDYVFDVNMGADFTVIEEANELLEKIEKGKDLPLFTSCCPAWVNYVQKFYPEYEKNLSSTKSPNEMLGSLVKYYFENMGKKVQIVSIMPCTAKKREIIARGTIDYSLTTRELGSLIKLKGIDFNSLNDSKFDDPFGNYSGAGLIFGVTGGVTEAALRYATYIATGKKQDIIESVRYSNGIKELSVNLGNKKLNLAIVHGLANAKKLMEEIKQGIKHFDFIEVMSCPGGCVNGGGQSFVDYDKISQTEVIQKRGQSLYKADGDMKFKSAEDNEGVKKIYEEVLNNDKELIHKLFHYTSTNY